MPNDYSFFATTSKFLEALLAEELSSIGAESIKQTIGGVYFKGDLSVGYRACLWSRIANRILLPLNTFTATNAEELYDGVSTIKWSHHFTPEDSFLVDCVISNSTLSHTQFCAQKTKDAIVDQFTLEQQRRPSVDTVQPDIRINCFIKNDKVTISLDLSGDSLHRRGYRLEGAKAPLKENLAAAILMRSKWDTIAANGASFIDPMCGSGTFPIEAAMIAADIAPGLLRERFGFQAWLEYDNNLWQRLIDTAQERKTRGLLKAPLIFGFDAEDRALESARSNAQRAGLSDYILFDKTDIQYLSCPQQAKTGLIVSNPPYGERLGSEQDLLPLYQGIGETLMSDFQHWHAAMLVTDTNLGKAIGIRADKIYKFFNGPLECKLLHFIIEQKWFMHQNLPDKITPTPPNRDSLSSGAQMFANRLKKNLKQLSRWAKQQNVSCYRLYDADMPEYALAIDVYQGEKVWVHVQEYAAPSTIAPDKAKQRLEEALSAIPFVLDVEAGDIFLKTRQKQRGTNQYTQHSNQQQLFEVEENGLRFMVNFSDYLDTGLFLDHRKTREMIRAMARGKQFLNLFAYTGTASVYAASGGAKSTTSIDMSRTYLEWSKNNFKANNIPLQNHEFIQEDCLAWLKKPVKQKFDLIFLDPPTFSNSRRMKDSFDIQRDHEWLIERTMQFLKRGGTLIFSNDFRRFKMSPKTLKKYQVTDISASTLPRDYQRNTKIHNCWTISSQTQAEEIATDSPWGKRPT